MDNVDERLTSLEVKVSYLEDFVNQLQEVVVAQAKEIDSLKNDNKKMSEKIRDLIDNMDVEIPNRKPPHY